MLDLHRFDPLAEVGGVTADMNHIPNLKVVAEFEDGHPQPIVIVGNLPNAYLHHQPLSGLDLIASPRRRFGDGSGIIPLAIRRSVELVPALR